MIVRGSGPPVPGPPAGETAAAWVLAGLVTGLVQFDSVDGEADGVVPGPVAAGSGVVVSPGSASAGSGAAGAVVTAGGGAWEEAAGGWDTAGGAGAGPPGWPGGSSGPFGLSVRPSPGLVSVGSAVQDAPQVGLVAVGSGESAAAAPAADRLTASARRVADAVAGTARSAGKDGDIRYLSMRAVPPLRLSGVPGSFLHLQEGRKSAGPAALRDAAEDEVRQTLFSGGSATWIFRALPRPTT